jgi:hypothetical protein
LPWIAAITGTGTSRIQSYAGRWNQLGASPPSAEALAFTVQNDGPDTGLGGDLLGRVDDRREHRNIERVVLVRPGEGDRRDVVGDVDLDSLLGHRREATGGAAPAGSQGLDAVAKPDHPTLHDRPVDTER